jgi:hypothetical protein
VIAETVVESHAGAEVVVLGNLIVVVSEVIRIAISCYRVDFGPEALAVLADAEDP